MAHDITSKNIDGITDLVVVAPIKTGFIHAYENVTYATRLRIVAEALNRVRVTAREHEKITPFSDVTERILTLLDFRVGVIDKDLFALSPDRRRQGGEESPYPLESRRFLYLTATFDGAWEPYMRLIWDPLGPFLDLLFCNCEGYVTATEHSFDEYAQWVRDNQMNSAIFYATTGLSVRDHLYLNRLEQLHRATPAMEADSKIARMTMPRPWEAARAERMKAASDLARNDPRQFLKIHEMGLEALTVLYRLADYYPPEWLAKPLGLCEGHYLMRATESLLLGWDDLFQPPLPPLSATAEKIYKDPLRWYRTGRGHLRVLDVAREQAQPKDPRFRLSEVQGGVLKAQGSREQPMRQGALLLFTIGDAEAARAFLKQLTRSEAIHFAAGRGGQPADGFFRTLALTADGLRRMGLGTRIIDWFPKEFREGMEARSGLLGDMRESHPRNWTLPRRNWPPQAPDADAFAKARPPIEMSEVDIVIQVRTASMDPAALEAEVARLARFAEPGVMLQGYEKMHSDYDDRGLHIDHFGFHDGISQPRPAAVPTGRNDEVRLGELLLGYRNDRDDFAPADFTLIDPDDPDSLRNWRIKDRRIAQRYQRNGTFLVVRKLEQKVETFDAFIAAETVRVNKDHPRLNPPMTEDRLKARMLGRWPDGTPLIPTPDPAGNDFSYEQDPAGETCPLAAHIRRTNPREPFPQADAPRLRKAPRLMRRGMSFDHRAGAAAGSRGLMFMAYNASIAEQFETIQRWINGGNSGFVASGHNDPILGVAPKSGALTRVERVFRFVEGDEVIRVTMPDPFAALHWGTYLFVPSRSALRALCRLKDRYRPLGDMRETHGQAVIARLQQIRKGTTQGEEWKRLLEDFDAKDPSERDVTPHVWSAIRWYSGGSLKIEGGVARWFLDGISPPLDGSGPVQDWDNPPDLKEQRVVLSASYHHVMQVLGDWRNFSTEEQLRRIEPTGIPIFVTQQPDDRYKASHLRGRFNYREESEATNAILMAYDERAGFEAGYHAGKTVLDRAKEDAAKPPSRDYLKMELRRQFLLPALEELCRIWYGLPDEDTFHRDAWAWQPPTDRDPPGARCPADFLAPSRGTFYPRPSAEVTAFAGLHGRAVHEASCAFVAKHRRDPSGLGTIAKHMFEKVEDDAVLARNLVGTMIGAIPPMDGNLRGILLEWLLERTLWRHQAALRLALGDRPASADFDKAREVLYGPVSEAMCIRPAPDLLYRTALGKTVLEAGGREKDRGGGAVRDVEIEERDLVIVSLASAAQRSLEHFRHGNVSVIFGGERRAAYQPDSGDSDCPVHACPAQDMAMGAIMGILAALLESGRIQPLPASLIVRISDWSA